MATRSISNIRSGREGRVASAVLGWPELKAKLKDLTGKITSEEANKAFVPAISYLYQEIMAGAKSVNLPSKESYPSDHPHGSVLKDIFTYNTWKPELKRHRNTALVGVRKRGTRAPYARGYTKWIVRRWQTRLRVRGTGKRARIVKGKGSEQKVGQVVGENLATMWELGTSRMPAKPWFRPAILRAQARVLALLGKGYADLIGKYAKANP